MVNSRSSALALMLVAPLLLAAPAHADVAPTNRCTDEGAECANGLPDGAAPWTPGGFAAGICTKKTCSRATPSGGGQSGVMYYDCLLCIANGGQGGSPSAGGSAGVSGSSGSPSAGVAGALSGGGSNDGCSCRVPGGTKPWTLAGAMLAVGAIALAGGRRRKR